jgi:hypothetical protein
LIYILPGSVKNAILQIFRNGTTVEGKVYFGAVDSRNQRKMLDLKTVLMTTAAEEEKKIQTSPDMSIDILRQMNQERKARHQRTKRAVLNQKSANLFNLFVNHDLKNQVCSLHKLKCLTTEENSSNCQSMLC